MCIRDRRYAFFMLAEYAGMVILSALAVVLFLGGWYILPGVPPPAIAIGPIDGSVTAALIGFGVTLGKIFSLVFIMVWFRATFPRLREDQLQRMSWLLLIPLALLQIIVVAVFKVFA